MAGTARTTKFILFLKKNKNTNETILPKQRTTVSRSGKLQTNMTRQPSVTSQLSQLERTSSGKALRSTSSSPSRSVFGSPRQSRQFYAPQNDNVPPKTSLKYWRDISWPSFLVSTLLLVLSRLSHHASTEWSVYLNMKVWITTFPFSFLLVKILLYIKFNKFLPKSKLCRRSHAIHNPVIFSNFFFFFENNKQGWNA